jgi:hypothetical protein
MLYAAEQCSYCPSASVTVLNYEWSAMTTLVNNMTANGNTNPDCSSWMSLVGGGPFTAPGMDPNYTYQQVIILLTDLSQNAGPLVHRSELDRRAAGVDLREHRTHRHHALHNLGQHGRQSDFELAAELRQQFGQVLPAHVRGANRDDVQHQRHQPEPAVLGE